jgi:hypothetical protein
MPPQPQYFVYFENVYGFPSFRPVFVFNGDSVCEFTARLHSYIPYNDCIQFEFYDRRAGAVGRQKQDLESMLEIQDTKDIYVFLREKKR